MPNERGDEASPGYLASGSDGLTTDSLLQCAGGLLVQPLSLVLEVFLVSEEKV